MKVQLCTLSFLIILLLFCPVLLPQGTLETRSFESTSLGVTKYYKIYLPPDYYQSSEHYPVVYFFRNHENEWFSSSSLKQVADDLIASGLIGKMILVGPNTGSNNGAYAGCINMLRPDLAPSYGIGSGMFEDYIVDDLITTIDTTFRTIADRQHRGIDGFSLGGFISTVISLRHPDLFSSVGSYDGTLMYYNLEDPGVPGSGPDDALWMVDPIADPIFDVPRNVPYMLEHSVTNILESADTSLLNLFKNNRYHISQTYTDGAGNCTKNRFFVQKLREKGMRNSWGNPLIHQNATHIYSMAGVHATASLIKHWQTFTGTKISAPSLIDFGITENTGKTLEAVVFNYGPGNITIDDILLNSAEFSVLNLPSFPVTLQPDTDSLVFNIKFMPVSNESFSDTAYIYSDDTATPVVKVILRGKGGSFKAEPGILYAATSAGLFSIDTDSLTVSNIGYYGNSINYIKELNIDPTTHTLYGSGDIGGTIYDLDIINTKGGDGFWYQFFNLPSGVITAAEIGNDGLLYLGSSTGNIYTADYLYPYSAPTVNLIDSTSLPFTAFAFSPVNGQLWAAVGTNEIYMIDINTWEAALIGSTGLDKAIDDLTFDSEGILYGLVGSGGWMDTLVTINTSTGLATKLGSLNTTFLNAIAISHESPSEVIAVSNSVPDGFKLFQNFPNPFNPGTKIKYSIPQTSRVNIKVFDVLGNEIETLVNAEKPAGFYELTWNASNLPSGVYFYRLQAGGFIQTKKMILLK